MKLGLYLTPNKKIDLKCIKDLNVRLNSIGNNLAVQWLGLHAFTAKGTGSTPGWGTEIPEAAQCSKTNKKTHYKTLKRKHRTKASEH